MTWVSPTVFHFPDRGQTPYFVAAYTGSSGQGGWTLTDYVGLAPATPYYPADFSTGVAVLTAVRAYFARTGTTDPGNLLCSIWRNPATPYDVTGVTPDATATIPLSSLPLVTALGPAPSGATGTVNLPLASTYLAPPTEATFDTAVTFTSSSDRFQIAWYLDTGFSATSNIVVMPMVAASGYSSNSFNWLTTLSHQWTSRATYINPANGFASVTLSAAPDLNFASSVAVRRSRAWAAVIG